MDGALLSLELASHPGQGLVPTLQGRHGEGGKRRWHLWHLKLGPADRAARVRVRGPSSRCTLLFEAEGAGLEVDCGRFQTANTVWLGKHGKDDNHLEPFGTPCHLDLNDGTISPIGGSGFVLGFDGGHAIDCDGKHHGHHNPWPAVLVPKGDARALTFKQLQSTGNPKPAVMPSDGVRLSLSSPAGRGLTPKFHGRHSGPDHTGRTGRTWILWTLELGSSADALELTLEGPRDCCRLRWPRENVCLEVNCRKMEAGNMIFLWNDDPPVPAAAHSTFTLNADGSISPHRSCPGANAGDPQKLVLGLHGSTCVLVRREDPKRIRFDWGGGNPAAGPSNTNPVEAGGSSSSEPVVVMGVVVEGVAAMGIGEGKAPTTLIEMVAVLKTELGIEGTVKEVIDQAIEQLGVSAQGVPLMEQAVSCMKALGR